EPAHVELGRLAAELGVDIVVAPGAAGPPVRRGAGADGPQVHTPTDVDAAAALLDELLQEGDLVLLKGSNGSGVWRLADQLTLEGGGAEWCPSSWRGRPPSSSRSSAPRCSSGSSSSVTTCSSSARADPPRTTPSAGPRPWAGSSSSSPPSWGTPSPTSSPDAPRTPPECSCSSSSWAWASSASPTTTSRSAGSAPSDCGRGGRSSARRPSASPSPSSR